MHDYDLTRLNDKEFEAFSLDLLSRHFGKRFERFKSGKDNGVDGRFFAAGGKEVVVQCKHWIKTGVNGLVNHIRNVEAFKVKKLSPSKYILVTSLPLSRKNKADFTSALRRHFAGSIEIFGKEDLNDLLSTHPQVEENHYKLWFSSSTVLTKLLNAAIKGRTDFKLEDAKEKARRYVFTRPHSEALEKLSALRSVIITGEPGAGKTMLAEQLALQHILDDYEVYCIAQSVEEAESIWNDETKQLFYFDDFLGRNYLLALNRHEDSHIVAFIKRVEKSKNKRFVLTSRTTVLNSGKQFTDLFEIENIEKNEYELCVASFSLFEKANILYNHMWVSELPQEVLDQICIDERYLKISQHKNFNPRLIEFITDANRVGNSEANTYWEYIESTLENPKDVWSHVYENQLTEDSRTLLKLCVANGSALSEPELEAAFLGYTRSEIGHDAFIKAMKLSVGAVLNREITPRFQSANINIFNPSLGDFIVERYKRNTSELIRIFINLDSAHSLSNLAALERAKHISPTQLQEAVISLSQKKLTSEVNLEYRIKLGNQFIPYDQDASYKFGDFLRVFILELLSTDTDIAIEGQADLLCYGLNRGIYDDENPRLREKIEELVNDISSDDEFRAVSMLIGILPVAMVDDLSILFNEAFVRVWTATIDDRVTEYGVLDDFDEDYMSEDARSEIRDYIQKYASEFFVSIESACIEEIASSCDYIQIIENSIENRRRESDDSFHSSNYVSSQNEIGAVRDLFEKG